MEAWRGVRSLGKLRAWLGKMAGNRDPVADGVIQARRHRATRPGGGVMALC